jgi:hypothetical protein
MDTPWARRDGALLLLALVVTLRSVCRGSRQPMGGTTTTLGYPLAWRRDPPCPTDGLGPHCLTAIRAGRKPRVRGSFVSHIVFSFSTISTRLHSFARMEPR